MQSTTRLKVGSGAHHCCWYLLIGFVIISSMPGAVVVVVRAHAPPRSQYYGQAVRHTVEPREPFKHIPASLMFGHSGGPVARDRLYDTPTCSQLRSMWKSSLRSLSDNNVINNYKHNLDSNEIPLILNNPYYMAFLWKQSLQHPEPDFGTILSKPPVVAATHTNGFSDRSSRVGAKSTAPKDMNQQTIPGLFMEKPSKPGPIYGHVNYSPEEMADRQQPADERHRYREGVGADGTFGAFADDINDSGDKHTADRHQNANTNNHNQNSNNPTQSSSTVKQQRTAGSKPSSTFSTADDFFKSGVWHEKPVVPSVTFHRIH